MRPTWTAVVVGLGLLAAHGGSAEPALRSRKDQVSYAMAVAMARSVQRQGVDIDAAVFAQGLNDALRGAKLRMTQDELRQAMAGVLEELKERQHRATAPAENAGRSAR